MTQSFTQLAFRVLIIIIINGLVNFSGVSAVAKELSEKDKTVKSIALQCRDEVVRELESLLNSNRLSIGQLFDTFYIPIPNTNPQKFKTQYDKYTDEVLRLILDQYLKKNRSFLFVIAVDKNGYLPTHNSKYSQPLTGNSDYDMLHNRTKRMFNDRTGLAAARNTKPYLLQEYERDTGEKLADFSIPIYIRGKHWGALRIGYKK